jgi:peptide/nickel transport system substrate-binding protein
MSWIRAAIVTPPLSLAALGLIAMAHLRSHTSATRHDLSMGIPGEPDTLNPILFTTQIANQIGRLIFDGLLRFDENLELAPDLASSWEQRQTTTIFFRSNDAAQRAATLLQSMPDRWRAWSLRDAAVASSELRLFFAQPGTVASGEIFAQFDHSEAERLTTIRVEAPLANDLATRFSAVKRVWHDGARATDFTFATSAEKALQEVGAMAGAEVAAKAKPIGEMDYLDEPEIVFHLRDDARWHDGTRVTADDVIFTFRAIMDDAVASPRRADYQLVREIETTDPQTIIVRYRKPSSFALNSWTIGLLPAHLLRDRPPATWAQSFNRAPIGTGPFRFAEWKSNERLTLTKNDLYFRGAPHLSRIGYRIIPDRLSMRVAFATDQIDLWELDPYSASQLAHDPGFAVLDGTALEYHFIGWNLRKPQLADRRVREALTRAIDIDSIIRNVIYNRATPSTGPFVPAMWFFNPQITPLAFDPARAAELLADAGWQRNAHGILEKNGEPFRLELVTNNDNQTRKDIAVLTQGYLRRIGIEVDVRTYEWAVFISQVVHQRAFDGLVLSWALRNDPDQFQIWHSSQAGPRQLNIAGYNNPRVDELLEKLRVEYDPARIKELAGELQKIIYEDQPYTFLYVPKNAVAVRRGRFLAKPPARDGDGWEQHPLQMHKAGLSPEWFVRVLD